MLLSVRHSRRTDSYPIAGSTTTPQEQSSRLTEEVSIQNATLCYRILPTMTKVKVAALYARISSDIEGVGLGVARQLQDCRKLAESLSWTVGEEYIDNDISAYSGKLRPSYQRMLRDLREGRRDAVIVYHVDRLTRRPIELEEFVAALDAAGVSQVRFVVGDMDMGTGDGLVVARISAAMAANESATKSRRMKRKYEQNAAAGLPHGPARPFGYEPDKVTINKTEAKVVRELVARFLAGESLRSLTIWLNDSGVPTVSGGTAGWKSPTVRGILMSARIAGLRVHRGEVVGPAVWKPIITEQARQRVLARFEQQTTTKRRAPRSYLLTGMLRCGRCGNNLFSSRRNQDTRRYVCLSGPDHGGCGRLTVVAEPVEALIADAVLYRLDCAELADALADKTAADEHGAEIAEGLADDRAQLEELAGLYARREVSATEWLAARRAIEDRVRAAERDIAMTTDTTVIRDAIGNGDQLRGDWDELGLDRRVAIVRAVLDHAVIAPVSRRDIKMDPDRVTPVWRL